MDIAKIIEELRPRVMGWMYTDFGTGWIPVGYPGVYGSATTMTFAGVDVTAVFQVGARVRWRQRETWYYGVVVSAAFVTDTTVTVAGNAVLNASIGAVWVSYAVQPQGWPGWFDWTPASYTGWSSLPTGVYRFTVVGRCVQWSISMSAGTSNATSAQIGLPISAATITGHAWGGANNYAYHGGVSLTVASRWNIGSAGTVINFYSDMNAGTWTNSGTKLIYAEGFYEI